MVGCLPIAAQPRELKCRLPVVIGRVQVGGQIDEQVQNVDAPARDREMQGGLAVIAAREPRGQRFRMLLYQVANHVEVAQGDRREDVMAGASSESHGPTQRRAAHRQAGHAVWPP
jgi:hypothetical protein